MAPQLRNLRVDLNSIEKGSDLAAEPRHRLPFALHRVAQDVANLRLETMALSGSPALQAPLHFIFDLPNHELRHVDIMISSAAEVKVVEGEIDEMGKGSRRSQQSPNPPGERRDEERIANRRKGRGGWQQRYVPGDLNSRDREDQRRKDAGQARPDRECRRHARHYQGSRPKRDAAGVRREAPLEAGRVTRQEQAFASDEDEKACGNTIVPLPQKLDCQEGCCDDKRNSVNGPQFLAQLGLSDESAGQTEHSPDRKADRSDDVQL
ncbi:MAG: hypothetical protein JO163_09645, partial [Methylobacteriaceae bacterium]|nr:hypothetical protein [Methylobacteriaceae bacterium]